MWLVDIREGSSTFGGWVSVELSSKNKRMLWIPEGFAHGFLALENETQFLYKTTNYYAAEYERSLLWNDAELGIGWPSSGGAYAVSDKDEKGSLFSSLYLK